MYIKELHYINVGPIERADVVLLEEPDSLPRPVIFVGKNGSGKSILLSNIVDCFYEIARLNYNNVVQYKEDGSYLYYKVVTQQQIKLGKNEMFSHIKFVQDENVFEYIYKRTELSKQQYIDKYGISVAEKISWNDDKEVSIPKEEVGKAFDSGVVCYFAPSRFAKPIWLGDSYLVETEQQSGYSLRTHFTNTLRNPIEHVSSTRELLQWILDVIVDARPEVFENGNSYQILSPDLYTFGLLRKAKRNVEKVFSVVLETKVRIRMLNRSKGENRFIIEREKDGVPISPSLEALSTGQLALLNIFGTIIQYADVENVSTSLDLEQIKGVVVIDEIELHLHAELQREVLPKLIKLFPRIQFIITSHSPLFLLGMQEEFGDDGFDVYEMPDAKKITVEQFSQFDIAYKYFQETKRFSDEIHKAIESKKEKALLITEGASDWRHMRAAINSLINDPDLAWLSKSDYEFLEYDPGNCKSDNPIKLEMGWSDLVGICEAFSKVYQRRKIIVIADCDEPKANKAMAGNPYKKWGNNVYSLCLPVPAYRSLTPQISIEHYYTDEEIKREVEINGIKRRLYMGNEFEEHGVGNIIGKFCEKKDSCGPDKIDILDGGGSAKVLDLSTMDKECNYALSKMTFAEMVYKHKKPFDDMDFSNFKELFSVIKSILDLPLE